jgi:phosphatidylglycerophosphate synthase
VSCRGLLVFDKSPDGSNDGSNAGCSPQSRVAGLSLLDRGVRTMVRAGVEHLTVLVPAGARTKLHPATQQLGVEAEFVVEFVVWGQPTQRPPESTSDTSEPTLILLADHVHHHSSLTDLVKGGLRNHDIVVQTSDSTSTGQFKAETKLPLTERPHMALTSDAAGSSLQFDPTGSSAAVAVSGAFLVSGTISLDGLFISAGDTLAFLTTASAGRLFELRPSIPSLWQRVGEKRRSVRAAKSMLFSQVTKATSGPVSRHLNARLSVPTSKLLVETGLSPHMVTVLLVLTTGLSAVYLLATPQDYGRLALAGFLWHMAAVFDRCDGEIARVKLCESKFGAWFDTVTDNIAYFAFIIALVVGMQRLHPGEDLYLYLSLSALSAFALSLSLMYRYALQTGSGSLQKYFFAMKDMPDSDKTAFQRATERFGFILKRDFFAFAHFVLCLLDAFQLMYWLTMIGIFGHAAGVILSQRRLITPTPQVEAPAGAAGSADELGVTLAKDAP